MTSLRRVISASVLLWAALVSTHAAAQAQTPEQEVLAFMITEYGRDAIVSDSAWGLPCERMRDACTLPEGVPADAWAEYLRVTRAPSLLRDVLAAEQEVRFASEHDEDPSVPCADRKDHLTLSRPGISADGNSAVIGWIQEIMIDHLGRCGASRGGVLLLRKNPRGVWRVDRPLSFFMS